MESSLSTLITNTATDLSVNREMNSLRLSKLCTLRLLTRTYPFTLLASARTSPHPKKTQLQVTSRLLLRISELLVKISTSLSLKDKLLTKLLPMWSLMTSQQTTVVCIDLLL